MNFLIEFLKAIAVLFGAPDHSRIFRLGLQSANRFLNWGIDSSRRIDLETAVKEFALLKDEDAPARREVVTKYAGIGKAMIAIMKLDQEALLSQMSSLDRKYGTDENLNTEIGRFEERYNLIQEVIQLAKEGKVGEIRRRLNLTDIKVRAEEILLDQSKELDHVKDEMDQKKTQLRSKEDAAHQLRVDVSADLRTKKKDVEEVLVKLQEVTEERNAFRDEALQELQEALSQTVQGLNTAGIDFERDSYAEKANGSA